MATPDRTPAPDPAAPAHGGSPLPLPIAAVAVAAGWALLGASALAAGDPTGVGRAAVTAALVLAALAAARWRPARTAIAAALAVYAVGLVAATLGVGSVPAASDTATRVALFTGNPNDLGAALVAAVVAWAMVADRWRWWAWLWPLAALAVVYTGSRTSGGALAAAFALWLVVLAGRTRARSVVVVVAATAVLAGLALAWQYGVVERTPNLLGAPNDLAGHDWRHGLAASVEVVDRAAPGPFTGTHAQRLVAQAREGERPLVFQSIARSAAGVPYVASLYLRAEAPQRLELSNHLTSTTCEVSTEWRRCVTPPGTGDDYLMAQFHVLAAEPGGRVDVLVYGAQYEIGTEATPFLGGRPDWIPQSLVRRFDLRRLTPVPADRVAIWRIGLDLARDHPWFGVGLPASQTELLARTRDPLPPGVTYAHNLLVHLLLVHGWVGLVGAALLGGTLVFAAGRGGGGRVAPLLVALALLNTWDLTLFEPEVALPVVAGLALAAAGGPRGRTAKAARTRGPRP